jgi:hypothetical protein
MLNLLATMRRSTGSVAPYVSSSSIAVCRTRSKFQAVASLSTEIHSVEVRLGFSGGYDLQLFNLRRPQLREAVCVLGKKYFHELLEIVGKIAR